MTPSEIIEMQRESARREPGAGRRVCLVRREGASYSRFGTDAQAVSGRSIRFIYPSPESFQSSSSLIIVRNSRVVSLQVLPVNKAGSFLNQKILTTNIL